MRRGHDMRWGGLAGIGAVLFAIAGRLVMGGAPRSTDPIGVIATFVNGNRGRIMTAMLLYAIAVALFLWFGATLATAFRRADDESDAPAVVLGGFILVSAIAFVGVAMFGGAAYALSTHAGLLILAAIPYTTVAVMASIAGIALAVPLLATAIGIMRTHVFPKWTAIFAVIVAAVEIIAAFLVWSTHGSWAPGSWIGVYVPGVLLDLWVLTASALLVREHLPLMTARTPHAMGPA